MKRESSLRRKAVKKLYEEEKVLQTGPAPATYFDNMDYIFSNMHFTDGNDDYQSNKQ